MKGNFQIILLVIFLAAGVFGVLVFSGTIPLGPKANQAGGLGTVVLWGTVPSTAMTPLITDFNEANKSFTVKYVQKFSDTFDRDLLEALAGGVGPDLFFIPDNLVFSYSERISTIPYTSYPLTSFKKNFVTAGEVFLSNKGISAFPLVVDPLMMYYNRAMLDSNGFVYPPSYWDDFSNFVPKLTQKNSSGAIVKSAFALGQFANVTHAKEILATLFMQTGNPIVIEKNGFYTPVLDASDGKNSLGPILQFYINFADALKNVYSWNISLPNSQDYFTSDNLAFYFGFASELKYLVYKNPNLNFLVAPIPQIKNSPFRSTFARVTGIAVSSFTKNPNAAFLAASLMATGDATTGDFASKFAKILNIAPARRNLLSIAPQDAYLPIFYSSALYAKSWLDPSPADTDGVFRGMVEKVLSNNMSPDDAMKDANLKLRSLLIK